MQSAEVMQAKRKRSFIKIMAIVYKKKKVNTCKNESSGDERERERKKMSAREINLKKALDLRQC